MTLLTIIVAIGIMLTLPNLALLSLHKDGATSRFRFDMVEMTVATFVGVAAIWASLVGTEMSFIDRSLLILLGGLLALGAWIDRVSAWAPDIIMLPFCIVLFLLAPEVVDLRTAAAAIGFGVALFLCGILLWIPQDASGYRFAPPADLIAIASPFVMFRISYETAAIFGVTSLLLLCALKSRRIASVFSRPEAVADGANDVALGDKPAVTFLSVIFPVMLAAIAGIQLARFIP